MSEKRFKICIDNDNGVGLLDDSVKMLFIKFNNKEDAVSCKDALKHQCDLMNELFEENEQLKQEMEIEKKWQLEKSKYYVKIKEENEMLKSENKKLQSINDQLEEQLESSGIGIALKMVCENDD